MDTQELALKALIRRRHLTYESFCREWDRTARSVDDGLTGRYPGRAQYYRWLRGELVNGRPYPDACRMLEGMFPGWSVESLFSPYTESAREPLSEISTEIDADQRLDAGVVIGPSVIDNGPDAGPTLVVPASSGSPNLYQIELLRQEMNDALSHGAIAEATIDDWERTAIRYARATRDRPPVVLLGNIGRDLAELKLVLSEHRSASALRRLTRVTAQLSGLMCLGFCILDDRPAFQRWARTARLAANEAGDPETLSWILAQEAYGHYYSGDLLEAIDVARHSYEVVRIPCTGAALAAALEARAHASMGRHQETREALARAEHVLSQLDGDSRIPSAFGYNESSFRFHEGNAYTHLHDVKPAFKAQERALELCTPNDYTDWAMTRLDRAECLIYTGEITGGLEYATDTVENLTVVQRKGIITLRGQEILGALPERETKLVGARDFRELLMLPAGNSETERP
jgi:tetratricopeptide (TPR) repeat protein